MAIFTSESAVREKFQLTDTTRVPASLVTTSIDDAHEVLLRFLDPVFDVPTPDAALVLGETLLAGANLLRSIASSEAFTQRKIALGSQRIDVSKRHEALREEADVAERRAWEVLEPFLSSRPTSKVGDVTDTAPILEEG